MGLNQAVLCIIFESTKRSELVFRALLGTDGTRGVRSEWITVG